MTNPSDGLNEKARDVTVLLQAGPFRIITSEMVLVEYLTFASEFGQHARKQSAEVVRGLKRDPNVEIIPQTSRQFTSAVERYVDRIDQRWSVTDCASFLVLEERGIVEALAHDHNFEQAGFRALLREP